MLLLYVFITLNLLLVSLTMYEIHHNGALDQDERRYWSALVLLFPIIGAFLYHLLWKVDHQSSYKSP